jgi:hypothetical protein
MDALWDQRTLFLDAPTPRPWFFASEAGRVRFRDAGAFIMAY